MATPITSVPGVGAQTAEILAENGFDSAEALAAAEEGDLVKISGFGPAKAQKFIEAAKTLLGEDGGSKENKKPEEQGAAVVEKEVAVQDAVKEQMSEQEEKPVKVVAKNPCTQKLCKKKKKIKKVRVKVKKKKKKGSSHKK